MTTANTHSISTVKDADFQTFSLKAEVSLNSVKRMIEGWVPVDKKKPTESDKPQKAKPNLYKTIPGEESIKKKRLQQAIVAKKTAAAAVTKAKVEAAQDAEDSKTQTVRTGSVTKNVSALDKYLQRKKGKK
ncbi:hypothetical protein HDU76_012435 [Blyttiomyces sp. JEL0837]|nr:hypothetical protein HDU76_012435 [Blyttiomyces sp. JEL0837]